MQIGKVIGRVTATRKDERLVGTKLLIAQPIRLDGTLTGTPIIAVDTVGAGVGEQVIFVVGSMAARAIANEGAPVDAAIVGIIDSLDSEQ
ncbi:ethanolamine utilization protein EutN [Paenibacillus stellifer]|uniref:Ethanolamine utilization protein EutN n=1 Tax=Paenibacillus stellifer TaxID=169760 RepID=A0A089LVC5_9BACL|nr:MULTISPECIES: EutN/CcmL family microcompartment protein [Paenibacillus]AIQ64847.1 ethanolamine utilization protein EutN [Paenibacillus stellifer]MBY9081389.1 EutN/CcmL family microcompartment protein [Paenibacillus sp. CGMCC 1.18879]MBY9084909.1 EutN/CcmL family microcompartment protein [Paenibacillus sinensis]